MSTFSYGPVVRPAGGLSPGGLSAVALSRRFGARAVVDALDLAVEPGAVVGLLGPNGCGKSTTMKLLAGALTATSGKFTLDGRVGGVEQLEVKRRTGFIPDVGGLFPRLTGWEHLELAGRLFGVADWQDRAAVLLDELDLAAAAHGRAGEYSHGMSRKLSAPVALLSGPALLLADEPFDGVDQAGIESLTALLRAAAAAGASVLVTTHLLTVAESLCDRVYLMRVGRVVASGPPTGLAPGASLARSYTDLLGADREDAGREGSSELTAGARPAGELAV